MRKIRSIFAGAVLAVISVAAGYLTMSEDVRIPVILDNGEVMMQPCCVTVDGKQVALVADEKAAKEVMDEIKSEYKNDETIDVRIVESTGVEELGLKNGDAKPEILTEKEAARQLVNENILTVETTERVVEGNTVAHGVVETETEELYPGDEKTVQEGRDGFVLETKEILRENGDIVNEKIIDKKVIAEPVDEIIEHGVSGFVMPLDNMRVTSEFGERWGRQHAGVDLGMGEGSPIYAVRSGVVTCAAFSGSYGNLVKVDHGNGLETYYAHCSRLLAYEGMQVEAGDVIAEVGSTGNSTGPHLHFEVRVQDQPQNPLPWLPF